jgi:hypothetical protein
MNLHLGCGTRYLPGWVNVDLYAPRVDLRADLRTVHFSSGSADRIRCIHTIEHFHDRDGVGILSKCAEWLAPEGVLEVETPDRGKCLEVIAIGDPLIGAKGLLGDRSTRSQEWNAYVERWAHSSRARKNLRRGRIAREWRVPGEEHLCVWTGQELMDVLRSLDLMCWIEQPRFHGARVWRDTRVIGIKP